MTGHPRPTAASPSPLAERAAAPSRNDVPAPTAGLTFRPLTTADAPAVLALLDACAPVDHAEERSTLEEVAEELAMPWLHLATDSLAGVDGAGTVRAYATVTRRPSALGTVQVHLDGAVDPPCRGLGVGRAVLAWQVGRARQQLADAAEQHLPGRIRLDVEDANVAGTAAVRAAGFTPARYFTTMRRDLATKLPDPAVPGGIRLVPLAPTPAGGDRALLEAVRVAHNEAFAGHWGSDPLDAEQWRRRVATSPHRRLDLSVAALDGSGGVLGYLVSGTYEQDWAPQGYTEGWVDLLGVVPGGRRRGLGSALLVAAMRAFRGERLEYAGLGVDVDNPSALDLYAGLGFETTTRSTSWTIEL